MKSREKQFQSFLSLAQAKETRATMDDHNEKIRKLSEQEDQKLTASRMRGKLLTNNLVAAYNPDNTVVWHSLFMPTEIFYAMDMIPFSTEMVAAGIAGAGMGRKLVETGEDYLSAPDSCSFVTCSYGGVRSDVLPEPDFIVTTSQLCDPERKLARFVSNHYRKKEFYIDVPYGARCLQGQAYQDAEDYLANQFKQLVVFLETQTGSKLDLDRLNQVFEFSNQAREWFLKVNELRQGPGIINGTKALDFSAVLLNIWGTTDAVEIYKALYQELLAEKQKADPASDKYRIGWIHLRPYYDNTLFNYLENEGNVAVVVEEINYIFWDELDIQKPFHSLARKVLANPAYSPVAEKFNIYQQMLDKYRVEGVIGFAHKGCRHYYSAIHLAAEYLKDKVPMLIIDGDCIDSRAYSFPLLKTRIDSLVEIMEAKRIRI